MIFKFWLWKISIKIRRLDSDSKIEFLTRNLMNEILKSGRNVVGSKNHGLVCMFVHDFGTSKAYVSLETTEWKNKIDLNL